MSNLESYRRHLREMGKLRSALMVLEWDQETMLPEKGLDSRAEAIGYLTGRLHDCLVAPELGRWLEALESETDLPADVAGSVRFCAKQHRRKRAVPPELVEAQAAECSQAQAAWVKARESSDFALFLPHLEKLVGFARRFADLYGFDDHPYDALLEEFEPGMTAKRLLAIVKPLREDLTGLLAQLDIDDTDDREAAVTGSFSIDEQRQLARTVLEAIGYDFEGGALHDVAHPFTIGIAHGDVRITNKYAEGNVSHGLFGALHEGGHALYHQGMSRDLYDLGLQEGSSAGIDEGMALILENQLGRDLPFWTFFQPTLGSVFPTLLDTGAEELFRAVNRVAPSCIRLEADELTYNLHIMLRTELEIRLIGGDIEPRDLPELWREAMERYVGIAPSSDQEGVLQDIHWAVGYFGYFPTYLLGTLYAAQFSEAMRRDIPDLDRQIEQGEIGHFTGWLHEKVYQYGGIYEPDELVVRATGQELGADAFMAYVTAKYSRLYGATD